jgi:hypothetical protein
MIALPALTSVPDIGPNRRHYCGDKDNCDGQIDYGDEDNGGFFHHQFGHFSFSLPYSWTVYDLDLPGAPGA